MAPAAALPPAGIPGSEPPNQQGTDMNTETVVGLDVAEAEFDRFAEAMDLRVDEAAMDEETKADFKQHKDRFIQAVCAGQLAVNDDGEPVYKLKIPVGDTSALTFHEPEGAHYMAMSDGKKKRGDMAQMYALLAAQCGVHINVFSKMKNRDLKMCTSMAALFTGG